MYNEEIKQAYLNYISDNVVRVNSSLHVFKYLEDFEHANDEDLYDMPYDIILSELSKVSRISSFATFRVHYYTIRNYKTWALLNGYVADNAKGFVDEKIDLKQLFLDNYHLTLYKSPAELANYLHDKLRSRSDNKDVVTIDQIATVYVMLVYQGLEPEQALKVKISDVIITDNNVAIITEDKAVIVYPEFEDDIKVVSSVRYYLREYANIKEVVQLNDNLIDNGTNNDIKQIRGNFASLLSSRQTSLKIKDVFYMGRLYDYYRTHNDDLKKQKVLEYCFNGKKLTKMKREQFYRFIELWNLS